MSFLGDKCLIAGYVHHPRNAPLVFAAPATDPNPLRSMMKPTGAPLSNPYQMPSIGLKFATVHASSSARISRMTPKIDGREHFQFRKHTIYDIIEATYNGGANKHGLWFLVNVSLNQPIHE
jgi:hypothetical protein